MQITQLECNKSKKVTCKLHRSSVPTPQNVSGPCVWIITSPNKPPHRDDHSLHQHHYQQSASIGLSSVGIISFAQTIRFGKEIKINMRLIVFHRHHHYSHHNHLQRHQKGLVGFSHCQLKHQLFTFTLFSPKILLVPIYKI